jgi:TIR domain
MADASKGWFCIGRGRLSRIFAARDTLPKIFISYRRADSAAVVGHLYERLVQRYGKDQVYRDIDNIALARNFYEEVRAALGGADIVLIVIGKDWLATDAAGRPRLSNSDDPVRVELEAALDSGASVIPVMVEDGVIPDAAALPESVKVLPALAGAQVRSGVDFNHHVESLIARLDAILAQRGKFVSHFPACAPTLAAGALMASIATAVGLLLAPLYGIRLSWVVALLCIGGFGLSFGVTCAFAGGHAAVKRRLPVLWCQKQPARFALGLGILAFAAALLVDPLAAPYLRSSDPVYLANRLKSAYLAARDAEKSGRYDFSGARDLVGRIARLDPDSGYVSYYLGEIKRQEAHDLFDALGCFRGWPSTATANADLTVYETDFHHYREILDHLPESETGGDPGDLICYERENGYCVQRTAWIFHLLANDFYLEAMASSGSTRNDLLMQADGYIAQSRAQYHHDKINQGFNQCTHGLYDKIEAALHPAVTAKAPSQ